VQIVETSPSPPSFDELTGREAPTAQPFQGRRRWPAVAAIVAVIVVLALVAVATSHSGSDTGPSIKSAGESPTDAPAERLTITALASIKFDQPTYRVRAGLIDINYSGSAGHTLVFDDPAHADVLLSTDAAGPHSATVDLRPGTYTIACVVPGHREQGMQSTIVVTANQNP
jgi:plastocyanin